MPYQLGAFRASDMVSSAAALRALGADAASREEVARRLVRALYDGFVNPSTGERECALVRLYETKRVGALEGELRARCALEAEDTRCLVLRASAGDRPAWCAPETSVAHRVIPLADEDALRRLPMLAQFVRQMGVPVSAVVGGAGPLVREATDHTYDVFYVPEARGCPHVPAQADFVEPHGIRSVLGFGGLLGDGELFAIVLFSKVPIPPETASLFRTVALAAKVALVSSTPGASSAAALGQLLEALETISHERFRSLERTLEELDQSAQELRRSQEALHVANAEIERRAAEAIRASEGRINRLWESNIIGVMYADVEGNLTDANDAFLRMIGYDRDDVRERRVRWSDATPPEYQPLDARGIAEAVARGACTPYEKVYIGKDGRRVPILIGYALLPGSQTEFICFAIDLTEQKRAEERERAARAEAERASRLKDEFVASVSHEIRTPLNAIQGWAQLLQRPGASPDQIKKGLDVITRNTHQLAQIASDLLDTSRVVAGKLHVEPEPVDLAEIVRATLEGMHPLAAEKGVALRPALEQGSGVHADPVRFRQVVENLVSNAIKFTPAGGHVDVVLARRSGEAVLRVRDTGQGIDPAFLPHVFDRFRQADASTTRRHRGLGLGLTIVKHVVSLHGGSVGVTSEGLGKGTEFTVTLPLASASPAARSGSHAKPIAPHSLRGATVLVVDDEPDAREIAARFLEEHGAVVASAGSAREALELLGEHRVDVVVSDIGMPEIDGYELARRLGGVPAVALTAFTRAEDKERATAAGFRAHVAKPVEAAELVAAVANLRAP